MIPSSGRRFLGWTAFAAGLGTSALGLVLAVQAVQPPADVGALPAPVIMRPATPAEPTSRNGTTVTGWAAPSRITIGALHVDAAIDAVGVRSDKALAVPDNPQRLGWWIGSAAPGSARGTVLLAGHVDTADQGPGALYRLEHLARGSTIDIRAAGRTMTYRTVARRSYIKQKLPTDLFDPDTAPRLILITCGGTFHHGTYSHNVVVYAQPVTATP